MFKDFSAAAEFVRTQQVEMIDLKFSDLWGRWHHVTISAEEFTPELMQAGVGFDGSSVGLKSVKSGDMALVPDLSTGFMDPFWETPTLSFICNTVEADSKALFARDPREIARRAERSMLASGTADGILWGPEFEFYIFSQVSMENTSNAASYRVEALEAHWNAAQPGHGHFLPHHGGYHAIPPGDQSYLLRSRMVSALKKVGIPVKYHHHEVGGPGQCEIETPLMGMIQTGDASMIIKYITRMVAQQAGQTVTYLPKPLYGEAGSGMHFHMQLRKNGENLFYDPHGPHLLSCEALYFIGGLLTHAPALLAFTNPSSNSYRRLVPGYEAPIHSFFSSGNRTAAIRVPKYATTPEQVRFEFRPPDATCNPYLATAAMLMAGMDGIARQIDPIAAGFGPFNGDISNWPEERRANVKSLPTSLEQAMQALGDDYDFLLKDDVFSEDMILDWIKTKMKEDYQIRTRPHPYEVQLYYDL